MREPDADRHRLLADGGQPPATEAGPSDNIASNPRENAEKSDREAEVPPMVRVYRHDAHKFRGRSHEVAADRLAGVRVNQDVPRGADADAAALSRPSTREPTLDNHSNPIRCSLVTGEAVARGLPVVGTVTEPSESGEAPATATDAVYSLLRIEEPQAMHRAWLGARVPAVVNEDPYAPHTSLKYHTLLAAALLDNYRAGHDFEDLSLVVDPPLGGAASTPTETAAREDGGGGHESRAGGTAGDERGAIGTPNTRSETATSPDTIVAHRTVFASRLGCLRLTATPGERPAAPLGSTPTRSFADVWARLPAHPVGLAGAADTTRPGTITTDTTAQAGGSGSDQGILDRRDAMLLDSQLRRIRSWSTALQYIEDYYNWRVSGAGESARGDRP